MSQYSQSVALFDFLPVLATALALGLLARAVSFRHRPLGPAAWAAAALATAGGACKASWKMMIALRADPSPALEQILFVALAPALVAAAFCMHHASKAWRAATPAAQAKAHWARLLLWLALPLGGAAAAADFFALPRLAFFWLLGWTTLGSAALCWNAISASRVGALGAATIACFVWNFAAAFALGGLARLPPGESTAWLQEGVNLSAQVALALGFWRLGRRMRDSVGSAPA